MSFVVVRVFASFLFFFFFICDGDASMCGLFIFQLSICFTLEKGNCHFFLLFFHCLSTFIVLSYFCAMQNTRLCCLAWPVGYIFGSLDSTSTSHASVPWFDSGMGRKIYFTVSLSANWWWQWDSYFYLQRTMTASAVPFGVRVALQWGWASASLCLGEESMFLRLEEAMGVERVPVYPLTSAL